MHLSRIDGKRSCNCILDFDQDRKGGLTGWRSTGRPSWLDGLEQVNDVCLYFYLCPVVKYYVFVSDVMRSFLDAAALCSLSFAKHCPWETCRYGLYMYCKPLSSVTVFLVLVNSGNLWCVFVQLSLVLFGRSQAKRLLKWISQHESSSTPSDDCDTDAETCLGWEVLVSPGCVCKS